MNFPQSIHPKPDRRLDLLFPESVVTVIASADLRQGTLYTEEAACLHQFCPKRRREYSAGRLAARQALQQIGINNYPLLSGHHREPLWPNGVVGSISHCETFCAAVVAPQGTIQGLGVDATLASPLPEDIIALVCTPAEHRAAQQVIDSRIHIGKLLFSAKESVYKCLFSLLQLDIDFLDVRLIFSHRQQTFHIHSHHNALTKALAGMQLLGRYAITDEFVFTGVTVTGA